MRMKAYYYEFASTGIEAVDRILSAVAVAGKMFHNTASWNDDCYDDVPTTVVGRIQKAADEAALAFRQHAVPLDEVQAPPDAAVAGRLDRSFGDLERALLVSIGEQQRNASPDNALIALLCDSVRAIREHVEYVQRTPAPAPPRTVTRSVWVCLVDTVPERAHATPHDASECERYRGTYKHLRVDFQVPDGEPSAEGKVSE